MTHDADPVGPLVVVPLHNDPQPPAQPTHLELIPMDTPPRRPTAPPCRKVSTEPCNLITFLLMAVGALLFCAGMLSALGWTVGYAAELATRLAVEAVKAWWMARGQ